MTAFDDRNVANLHSVKFNHLVVVVPRHQQIRIVDRWAELGSGHNEKHVRCKLEEEFIQPLVLERNSYLSRKKY